VSAGRPDEAWWDWGLANGASRGGPKAPAPAPRRCPENRRARTEVWSV